MSDGLPETAELDEVARALEEGGAEFRWTRYSPMGSSRKGMFRTIPLALRFLRLAAGLTQEEMAEALGVETGMVEAMERGNAIPTTGDADTWLVTCDADLSDLGEAVESADLIWPPDQAVLELPCFHGPDAPTRSDFVIAERLIHRVRNWEGVVPPPGIATLADTAAWLRLFFALPESLMAQLASIGSAELLRVEPDEKTLDATDRMVWGEILGMWFNTYLACQAPVGCRYFPVLSVGMEC